ncbi:MAG: superoxide dismutase [Methylovulum sp.]|nr:superoxide dismutase [Methylovulum sp.]
MDNNTATAESIPISKNASNDADPKMHQLPPLPYAYADLEPHIDTRTLMLHHNYHHASYVDKLNTALEPYPELQRCSAQWLLLNIDSVPEPIRSTVQNNAGGHLNHSLYWRSMAPNAGGATFGALGAAIIMQFSSFEEFKTQFEEAGSKVFGSGWVWLVCSLQDGSNEQKLAIVTTPGHENPLQKGQYPLLVNDVWEHAYYLKYENRRPDYLKSWWSVANWKEAEQRFQNPRETTDFELPEDSLCSNPT